MKKFFYISNRNSGKTNLAVFEFLKDPENSLLVSNDKETFEYIIKSEVIPKWYIDNVILRKPNDLRNNFKKIIFDDYLQMGIDLREFFFKNFNHQNIDEIHCFSTPKVLYSSKMYHLVKEIKKNNVVTDIMDFFEKDELILEINDPTVKPKNELKNEVYELYYNYLTDPDTLIINNKFFYNQKIYKLENVSYFPEIYREFTELKGEFLLND